ncbi:MAG: AtpZ/AtpI family protein [Ruminococcaceae bacterium]|nr:AtpZ/AtpI family protein [Oscillospiraceae bacterium]
MKESKDMKDTARLVARLSHITGFGISLVAPIFLLVFAAMWLREKYGVGDWVMAAAIVCGFISAGFTFYHFVSDEIKRAHREGEEYLRRQEERAKNGGGDHET